MEVGCERCGKLIKTYPSKRALGWDRWCSQECRYADTKTDVVPFFWSRIDKTDGCWLWQGSRLRNGYGHVKHQDIGRVLAHRFSYELHNGPIPDGLMVCHTCDVRHCVNPSHLFLGTARDNLRDASRKGRLPHGETHPNYQRGSFRDRNPINGQWAKEPA